MRPSILILLAVVALSSACTTIHLPLPGTTIMRPRAGLGDAGARVSVGAANAPSVEGTIEEVKDSNGKVINPLPGEEDVAGNERPDTTPMLNVELGVDWSKRYEFGLSSTRGAFFMWDYALWDNAALTLTPSYSSASAEGGDPEVSSTTNDEGEDTITVDYGFEGKATNFNVTQLASAWVGSLKWASLFVYGGAGVSSYSAEITHKESGHSKKSSQVSPNALAGVHLRLLIFELTYEAGAARIKYRDGTTATVPTGGATLAMHISI